jgi:hypothetical protein
MARWFLKNLDLLFQSREEKEVNPKPIIKIPKIFSRLGKI